VNSFQIVELVEVALVVLTIGLVAYSPIARAIGQRILHGRTPLPGASAPADERVDLLSGEVATLREQLDATQDRLDFTERLLAQARDRGALGPGNGR
jgi:hypothetical protein